MKRITILVLWFMLAQPFSWASQASDFTPLGAQKGANANGSIPAWEGGIKQLPDGYRLGGYHLDPYANDAILFEINASNWQKYKDNLSPGQQAMFIKHADFVMPIYPTRRSASYPEFVYKAVVANEHVSKLDDDGAAVKGGGIAIPFPKPKNGLEAIWNHLLRYRSHSFERTIGQVAVYGKGAQVSTIEHERILLPYAFKGGRFDKADNILAYLQQEIYSPSPDAGTLILVHEPLDKLKQQRQAWLYSTEIRRVIRAPYINYDSTPPPSKGLRTFDQYDMFNGAPDRYEWFLEGKEEIFVPYNAYHLEQQGFNPRKILGEHFIKPEYTRNELHRVWKVKSVLKKGKQHIYGSRVFYIDEDSWQILLVDIYDQKGKLWRFSQAHTINFYEMPLILTVAEMCYDLKSGEYLAASLLVKPPNFSAQFSKDTFTPDALRRQGKR